MLMPEKTFAKFGYLPSSLSNGSKKKVIVRCDYCDEILEKTYKTYCGSRKVVAKDACIKCRFKKREEISLCKHGVKNSAQRQEVRQKISSANAERLRSESFKEQYKTTCMGKYGVSHPTKNPEIHNKIKNIILDKYGVDNVSKVKHIKEKATAAMIETKKKNGTIKTYKGKTRPQLAKETGFSRSHFGKLVNNFGIDQALNMTPTESSLETQLRIWLDKEDIDYEQQFRVENRIADFKIKNIIVELDGLYWHSDFNIEDKNYHAKKRQLYIDNGYTPLFFREDEIKNKFPIVKSIIWNKLGKSKRVFGRKCSISSCSKDFFANNHLMGKGYGTIYSLEHENQTVAAIQIRRIRNKNYEISRFCTSLNTNVLGGFSKLLKHVESTLDMESLKTFIDLRYGMGNYLEDMGFIRRKSYLSFRWTNGLDSIHRLKYRGVSGYALGFARLWDCGQLPFIKTY